MFYPLLYASFRDKNGNLAHNLKHIKIGYALSPSIVIKLTVFFNPIKALTEQLSISTAIIKRE